jgi:hypothetical protein
VEQFKRVIELANVHLPSIHANTTQAYVSFKRCTQADVLIGCDVHPCTTHSNTIQTIALYASDSLLQVCRVRGGGGRLARCEYLSER